MPAADNVGLIGTYFEVRRVLEIVCTARSAEAGGDQSRPAEAWSRILVGTSQPNLAELFGLHCTRTPGHRFSPALCRASPFRSRQTSRRSELGAVSILRTKTGVWNSAPYGRGSGTLARLHLLSLRMGIPQNSMPRMWRGNRTETSGIHRRRSGSRGMLRHLQNLHQDDRHDERRPCRANGR